MENILQAQLDCKNKCYCQQVNLEAAFSQVAPLVT